MDHHGEYTVIFGGSFSPVHNGHLGLASYVWQEGLAEEVWLMVSPRNPLKTSDDLWPDEVRLRLTRLAAANVQGVKVSDFEFSLPRPSYTVRTMEALENAYPERRFALLIGADNWLVFDRWAEAEKLKQRYPLLVYPRPGYEIDETGLPKGSVYMRNAPIFPFSSTEIRRRLNERKDCAELLPPPVLSAINQKF